MVQTSTRRGRVTELDSEPRSAWVAFSPSLAYRTDERAEREPETPTASVVDGPRWWEVLLGVSSLCAVVDFVVWTHLGLALAVAAAAGEVVMAAGVYLAIKVARWRPMADRSQLVSRLPLAVVVIFALVVVIFPGRAAWEIGGAALGAGASSVVLPGSTVLDENGQEVAVLHANATTSAPVPLSAVAPVMLKAVVDTEDARFWHHDGVDLYSLVRAGVVDTFAYASRQGGSTLAMQLVKNTLLSGRPDDPDTKVQEMVLAYRLERQVGATGVLTDYLNTVYFGEGAYGVQAASEAYFGVAASSLDTAQAALLAGLIQSPVGYDPLRHPAAAVTRRRTVLDLMVAHHDLNETEAQAAAVAPIPNSVHPLPSGPGYFLAAVEQELLANPALGPTRSARYHKLFSGGLTIHTALNGTLEQDATAAVAMGLPASTLDLSAALVAIDSSTGAVRAVVGGPSFSSSQFDAAVTSPGRPTGSLFKMFVLVAALEQGWQPTDTIDGSGPCSIANRGGTPDPWVVDNYEGEAFGNITISTATANSVNCAFARLALRVGFLNVAQVANRMGVTVPLDVVPSMILGTNSVPPIQMAAAYATLADGGVYHRPHLVTSVGDGQGHTLWADNTPGVQVLDPSVVGKATQVLQEVVRSGTGTAAALPGHDVAGKTGTSENYGDAWFVGYTGNLTTAVWMGSTRGEVPMLDVGGISVVGGTYPARIWHGFMAVGAGS